MAFGRKEHFFHTIASSPSQSLSSFLVASLFFVFSPQGPSILGSGQVVTPVKTPLKPGPCFVPPSPLGFSSFLLVDKEGRLPLGPPGFFRWSFDFLPCGAIFLILLFHGNFVFAPSQLFSLSHRLRRFLLVTACFLPGMGFLF